MSKPNKKYRVAIVDDHLMFLEGMEKLLGKFENLHLAGAYLCAESLLVELPYIKANLVFLDISMPGMQGYDAVYEIKKFDPKIKVIAVTTYSDGYPAVKMLEAGVSGYVTKNLTVDFLKDVLAHIERGENYIPEEITLNASFLTKGMNLKALSSRDIEIIKEMDKGKTNKQIGEHFEVSERTIENQKHKIAQVLGVPNSLGIIAMAYKLGILS